MWVRIAAMGYPGYSDPHTPCWIHLCTLNIMSPSTGFEIRKFSKACLKHLTMAHFTPRNSSCGRPDVQKTFVFITCQGTADCQEILSHLDVQETVEHLQS
ncbi:hypothetical protein BaRGS_00028347 [Batillaria attramentaria]|uniref:Uncharacterized protein n=1 Tax=Batillaria attramentaria TaxID=370345 RepID=A0ABD0K040_9CAEN